jgi:trk system potassium uptake protein TrkA
MGVKIAYSLASTNFLDYIELSDGYRIIEVTCPKAWVGKSVVDLKVRNKYSVNILAVRHKDKFMVSNFLNHPFEPEDLIVMLGNVTNLSKAVDLSEN